MNIDSIQNGVVLDHIQAGKSMDIYKYLHLDELDCQVAIIKNARSEHMGKKDIIKIDCSCLLNSCLCCFLFCHVLSKNLIKLALIRSFVLYFFANLILLFDYITIFKQNLSLLQRKYRIF